MANGSSFLFGTPERFEQVRKFQPQQEQVLMSLLNLGQQNLQNPLAGFEPLKQRAEQRFQQETVPALLQRFSSAGDMGISSPSLKAELSQGASSLQERLAGLETQYRSGREQLGMKQLQMGLEPMLENILLSGGEGIMQPIATGFGKALPDILSYAAPAIGTAIGGPVGTLAGAGLSGLVKLLSYLTGKQL